MAFTRRSLTLAAVAVVAGEAFELGDLVLVSTDPEELRLFATVASHLLNANDIHVSARALLMVRHDRRSSFLPVVSQGIP